MFQVSHFPYLLMWATQPWTVHHLGTLGMEKKQPIYLMVFLGMVYYAGLPHYITPKRSGGVQISAVAESTLGRPPCVVYPHTLCHQSLQLLKRKGRRPPLQKKELKIAVGLLWNLLRKLVSLCNWWMTTFFFLARICIHRVISGFNGWSHLEVLELMTASFEKQPWL